MVSQKVIIVMGCVSITVHLMSGILLLFTATTGMSILSGLAVYNSMDIEVPGEFNFLGAEVVLTIIFYTLLIILAVMGSIFAMLDSKFHRAAIALLVTSQILIVIVMVLNIIAIGVFNTEKSRETFDVQKYYVLNILIVFYLAGVMVYDTVFIVMKMCSTRSDKVNN
ncbi:hypothetical protein LOD99_13227 [Oopsacas minuta]|uniref:Uncharacterized protein n=1 Tax=Oopsacas minuta TaxID=111878 RepID=A0AAV7JB95_9METZ|nr:hypothetical protein LOD99_13227 [Oopsacas minuta]